jgi:hypothetical protein
MTALERLQLCNPKKKKNCIIYLTLVSISSLNNSQNSEIFFCENMKLMRVNNSNSLGILSVKIRYWLCCQTLVLFNPTKFLYPIYS